MAEQGTRVRGSPQHEWYGHMDTLSSEERSEPLGRVRNKDTQPAMVSRCPVQRFS
jgi:hypothetical protein